MRVRLSVNDPFIVGSAKLRPREKRSLERPFTLAIDSPKLGDGAPPEMPCRTDENVSSGRSAASSCA